MQGLYFEALHITPLQLDPLPPAENDAAAMTASCKLPTSLVSMLNQLYATIFAINQDEAHVHNIAALKIRFKITGNLLLGCNDYIASHTLFLSIDEFQDALLL